MPDRIRPGAQPASSLRKILSAALIRISEICLHQRLHEAEATKNGLEAKPLSRCFIW